MRGVKVLGQSSMLRSSACPGLIICTDHQSGEAAFRQRQVAEKKDEIIASQSQQISDLQSTVKMLVDHLGIEIPTGGENVDTSE